MLGEYTCGKIPANRADLRRLPLQRLAWLYATGASTIERNAQGQMSKLVGAASATARSAALTQLSTLPQAHGWSEAF
jgi:hypothetical protein